MRSESLDDREECKAFTATAYNRWSRIWGFARYTNGAIYDAALERLDCPHRKVLDVGCGTGLMSAKLAASGRQVVGVDLSPGMIEQAQRSNGPGITFMHGDAEKLPLEDHS